MDVKPERIGLIMNRGGNKYVAGQIENDNLTHVR